MRLDRKVASLNRWRDSYNPLRGLVLSRVIALLEAGERGEFAELQWLYRFVEKRYPTLRALIKRWRGAIGKLNWEIKIKGELPEGASDDMAEKQRKTLRAAYERIDNLKEAIHFLISAEFRGYALLNKHRAIDGAADGAVIHLEPIDQWNWVRDGLTSDYYYNKDAQQVGATYFKGQGAQAVTIGHPDFVVMEEEMPIDEIAVILFLRGNLCEKDWDAFIELFGIERPVVIGPPNVPTEKEGEYKSGAELIADGNGGYLPNGSDVKYPGQRGQGGAPFKERLDHLAEQLVLAGTSGLLTMLAKNTGLGKGSTDAHADAFDDLASGKALEISEVFQKQFDLEVLAAEHANEPVCVYFELCPIEEEDAGEVLENASKAKNAGFDVDAEELSERSGYKLTRAELPEDGAESGKGERGNKVTNRADATREHEVLAAAIRADLRPFLNRLGAIMGIEDESLRTAKLQGWLADYSAIRADILADPESARVLNSMISAEFVRGLSSQTATGGNEV